jgi:hypothetical protein
MNFCTGTFVVGCRFTLNARATGTFRSTITSDVMASMNRNFIQAVGPEHVDIIAVFRPFKQRHCFENNASLCSPCKIVSVSPRQRHPLQHPCLRRVYRGGTHVTSQVLAKMDRIVTCHELDVPRGYSSDRFRSNTSQFHEVDMNVPTIT